MNSHSAHSDHQKIDLSKVRVLIADRDSLVSEAVALALEDLGNFNCENVDTLQNMISLVSEDKSYDLVLIGLNMTGTNSVHSLGRIIQKFPDTKLALFSSEIDPRFLAEAMRMGFRGFISKRMRLSSLHSVLNLIVSGESFIPTNLKLHTEELDLSASDNELTNIESAVLRYTAAGLMNKEIGDMIAHSEVAIKMHMRAICKKLGAKNRTHAAMLARDLGLV